MTNNIEFPASVKCSGCGVFKINIPQRVISWIQNSEPGLVYLERAVLISESGKEIEIDSPHISKGGQSCKYIPIPKSLVSTHGIKMNDIYRVNLKW